MSAKILSYDQGTTSSRTILFDESGTPLAVAQREFTQIYPRPGWVEHDPMEIWSSQSATAAEVMARAGIQPGDIAAIGVTNQRETTVVWERDTGRPLHNAIVWQDRRTAPLCEHLKAEGAEPLVTAKTGLRLDPYFSATKVRWILDNVTGARARAEAGKLAFGTVDSWLLWQLTGGKVHATDVSNASRTLLFNIHQLAWDDDLLALFGIPRSMMPEVLPSTGYYGCVSAGLPPSGVPISGVAGDQHAALFGQACFEPGMIKTTYGTGCFLLMNTGSRPVPSHNNLLTTIAWQTNEGIEYALEGSVFVAGAVVQWLRDGLRLVTDTDELNQLAGSVPDTGGVYLVPAFSGLGAPHWDPHARGVMTGLTRGTTREHMCRAALESIAYQTADVVECMRRDSGLPLGQFRVDGGAAASDLLLQFQADLLGIEVVRPRCIETTALGAACLAGLGAGIWSGRTELARQWQAGAVFHPMRSASEVRPLLDGWHRAVERCLTQPTHADHTTTGKPPESSL